MSLRISMQTQSPCLTPDLARPEAMRSARSATSAWERRRSGDNAEEVGRFAHFVFLFERTWMAGTSPAMTEKSSIRILRRALLQIGAHRFGLVRAADQLLLLDRLGQQCRARVDREIVEQSLRRADRIGTLAGDLARDVERSRARIVADA